MTAHTLTRGALAVEKAIRSANAQGRAALIVYLPACFPDLDTSVASLLAAVEAGADVLEIGFPYSDPLLDGPTIQDAYTTTLATGCTPVDFLGAAADVTGSVSTPCLVMTYYNAVSRYGADGTERGFAEAAGAAGLAGAIVPDLPPEEARPWRRWADESGLCTVFMASPSSTVDRLQVIADVSTGFVYATSVLGVTGERKALAVTAKPLVDQLRTVTARPICVGIGISTREQAAQVAEIADGVIVGSATTRAVATGGPDAVAALVASLAAGCRR